MHNTKKTILIVDDVDLKREMLTTVLQDEYCCLQAEDGEVAIAMLEKHHIDLMILDLKMPKLDGFGVLAWMQENKCDDVPVIVISVDDSDDSVAKAFSMGAIDYLSGKFAMRVIRNRVRSTLALNEQIRIWQARAQYDSLTGLYNRKSGEVKITNSLTANPEQEFSLIILDVDKFKAVNDGYGHIFGDKVLKVLGEHLEQLASEAEIVCRLGGDEFVAFLEFTGDAEALKQRLSKALTFDVDGYEIQLSGGIAATTNVTRNYHELMTYADKALYMAKKAGRNNFRLYE